MVLRIVKTVLATLFTWFVLPAGAANLMQVYYEALNNDPSFKQSTANWMSAKQDLPIARSGYLPQLDLQGNYYRATLAAQPVQTQTNTLGYFWSHGFNINLTQPIFSAVTWAQIEGAQASVKAATATYAAAAQDLIVRTTVAYFNVLRAADRLQFTLANKRAVYRQLITAEQKFKVGLIAITGVYDAQSVYDQAIATEIADRNSVYNALEDLRAITGRHYRSLIGIGREVPLDPPKPNDIYQWVRIAERQNYTIKSQEFSVLAARQSIRQSEAGNYPTFNALMSYAANYTSGHPLSPNTNFRQGQVGVTVDFPLIQGGLVVASTRQARYNFLSATSQLEFDHRLVINQTRQAFLGIISGISQIKADLQAIKSAKNALEATKAGYLVGTRTMVDVLNDLTTVYSTQNKYVDDQYAFLNNIINLKASAGTLSVEDLQEINRWLNKDIVFALPNKFYGHHVPSTPLFEREDRAFDPNAINMVHMRNRYQPKIQMVKLRLDEKLPSPKVNPTYLAKHTLTKQIASKPKAHLLAKQTSKSKVAIAKKPTSQKAMQKSHAKHKAQEKQLARQEVSKHRKNAEHVIKKAKKTDIEKPITKVARMAIKMNATKVAQHEIRISKTLKMAKAKKVKTKSKPIAAAEKKIIHLQADDLLLPEPQKVTR